MSWSFSLADGQGKGVIRLYEQELITLVLENYIEKQGVKYKDARVIYILF